MFSCRLEMANRAEQYEAFIDANPYIDVPLEYPTSTVKLLTYELRHEYRERYNLAPLSLFAVDRSRALVGMLQGIYFLLFRPLKRRAKGDAVEGFLIQS